MIYEPEKKCIIGYVKILKSEKITFLEKLKYWLKYIRSTINIKSAASNIIFEIPFYKEEILSNAKIKKIKLLINKLNKEIEKRNIDGIVISDDINQIIKKINDENVDSIFSVPVLNGKFLMKNLIIDIINKIAEQQNQNIMLYKTYVLVEKYNKENLDILYDLSDKIKNISIVTNNIKNFKKLEEKIFNNSGADICVANNRKKSMRRAELVINFDFDSETIRKYNINREAIIINCTNGTLSMQPGFSGVIINGIKLEENIKCIEYFKINDLLKDFDITQLYESLIFNKYYDKIIQQKNKDKIKIKGFIGSRGIINIKEFESSQIKNVSAI